ncbi:hypothetical protein KCU83_g473, partial [Aureobasidium melanogenum]
MVGLVQRAEEVELCLSEGHQAFVKAASVAIRSHLYHTSALEIEHTTADHTVLCFVAQQFRSRRTSKMKCEASSKS